MLQLPKWKKPYSKVTVDMVTKVKDTWTKPSCHLAQTMHISLYTHKTNLASSATWYGMKLLKFWQTSTTFQQSF